MKVLLYLTVTLMIFIAFPSNVSGQDVIFQSCMNAPNLSESYLCENEKMAQIIEKRILKACNEYKRASPNSKLNLLFNISEVGIIKDIKLLEFTNAFDTKISKTPIYIKDTIIHDFKKRSEKPWYNENNYVDVKLTIADYGAPISKIIVPNSISLDVPKRELFQVVEEMPRFPGCEDLTTQKEKEDCSKKKYQEYIDSNLIYPANAKKNGIQGEVVVQYIIEVDGSISDINVVRKLNDECDKAAVDVIKSMNKFPKKWIPGKQRKNNVRVLLKTTISFKL